MVAADHDAGLSMVGMYELSEPAAEPKKMVVLERAGHLPFVDDVEKSHNVSHDVHGKRSGQGREVGIGARTGSLLRKAAFVPRVGM